MTGIKKNYKINYFRLLQLFQFSLISTVPYSKKNKNWIPQHYLNTLVYIRNKFHLYNI